MPSVRMRRSTRVFGARVLRSGKRLLTARYDGSKHIRAAHGEDKWTELLHDSVDGGGDGGDLYKSMWQENEIDAMDMTTEAREEGEVVMKEVDRPCRIVYKRRGKRMRMEATSIALKEDKRFGKKYARKQWRKKSVSEVSENGGFQGPVGGFGGLALAVIKSDYDCGYLIACLLASILSYMAKVGIGMRQLSEFLLLKPLSNVYSLRGVIFLQDSVTARNFGACVISGSRSSIPLFSCSASAVPSLFVQMQTSMHFRFACLDCLFAAHSSVVFEDIGIVTDNAEEGSSQISVKRDQRDRCPLATQGASVRDMTHNDVVCSSNNARKKELPRSAPGLPKYALRNLQIRNSRKIRKRRSSLRRKRRRPTSAFRSLKTGGALHSDVFRIRQEGVQLAAAAPGLRGSCKNSSANTKDLKSALGMMTQGACAKCCSANLLVSEREKCYREEGAIVTLELSTSNQWIIVVSKDGTKRYNLVAQKAMRPSWNNRFTHATIWMVDSGWKLEFPNRQDWLIFKELYKECYDRNLQSPSISVIPVPGVYEVPSTVDAHNLPYERPDSYITMKDDELTRVLERKNANYDMDSDDEAWLSKLNKQLFAGRELEEPVTPDSFELVIDGIEKATHCNPEEHLDGQAVYDFCMHLERREVIEAIHNYWIKKRKQNHSALVRIFQLYQPRRTQVIPKSIWRKKRSFKRQTSQGGRGKQRPLLQAIASKQDVSEQKIVHKLQEAKAAAERSEGLAIQKRQRAQILMENADLATYRALMALRIAEAALTAEKPDTSDSLG